MLRIFRLKNAYLILIKYESLYQKGWQLSSHLITSINIKVLSPENAHSIEAHITCDFPGGGGGGSGPQIPHLWIRACDATIYLTIASYKNLTNTKSR